MQTARLALILGGFAVQRIPQKIERESLVQWLRETHTVSVWPLSPIKLTRTSRTAIVGAVSDLGKVLIIVGLIITTVGILLASGIGRTWLGRLPGDLNWSQGPISFHFPIMTCLIVSVILSLLMWFFRR